MRQQFWRILQIGIHYRNIITAVSYTHLDVYKRQTAFEQCAGFIRIVDGDNPLDNTPVHPESYSVAEALLHHLGYDKNDLNTNHIGQIRQQLQTISVKEMAQQLQVGEPTLRDIIEALQKPGRDPREELEPPLLRSDVLSMEDLKPGMELTGTVRNVVDFGAFVDIGVKQDGLIHISQFGERFIKHQMCIRDRPVQYINQAEDYVVADGVSTVRVTIRGKEADLTSLRSDDFTATVDLTNAVAGSGEYDITVEAPSVTEKFSYLPVKTMLTIDQMQTKDVSVRVRTCLLYTSRCV